MKHRWRDFTSVFVIGILELLLIFPIVLVLYLQAPPTSALWQLVVMQLFGYAVGFLLNVLLKFRNSVPLLMISLIVAGGFSWMQNGGSVEAAVETIVLTFCLFRGERLAVSSAAQGVPPRHYSLGLLAYFIVSVIFGIKHDYASSYQALFTAAGLLVLVLALFKTNRGLVDQESLSGSNKPMVEPTVRRHNQLFVGILLVITILIVFSYQIQALFGSLWSMLVARLAKLFSGSGKQNPVPEPVPNEPPPELPFPDDVKPPSHWGDYIMYGLLVLIAAALLWLVIRKLKYLPSWFKQLREKLAELFKREKQKESPQGYVDDIQNIKKPGRIGSLWRSSFKEPKLRWKDLNDYESRIRYLYRQWVGRRVRNGYSFKPHFTPSETGAELSMQQQLQDAGSAAELVRSYNSVRYGGKPVSDEQLRQLKEQQDKGGR
ncbi:hypothetical protein Back11_12950 [Paenibacillus baekrokdamisoli]|uniref:Uncharacterized protein n=1 Tax=Paenibacillus baekrokdamisoli TaxID=1712516 RepID=A0A3G9IM85_9BACL|nr:DUF4129 domain-containing protein [Paenibacillus baekrokdamisoli]MBB3070600.1 hypothetical protein [Paenibacillus baekrokdamisoli]BBH19950.1 hypothetical protein Back11_12950 [Paenibacillus baekrokdamisoli]